MKRNFRIAAAVVTVVLLVFGTVFVVWASDASAATDTALQALNSDGQVNVSAENGWVIFVPAENQRPETGFIFYPGGKVDYRAYAPVLKRIASKGYFVAVVPAPLNLAFFDINAAARVEATRTALFGIETGYRQPRVRWLPAPEESGSRGLLICGPLRIYIEDAIRRTLHSCIGNEDAPPATGLA